MGCDYRDRYYEHEAANRERLEIDREIAATSAPACAVPGCPTPAPEGDRYTVEAVSPFGYTQGWRIVDRETQRYLNGFKTRREAEIIADFFNGR